jgi:hypothetical protein
MRDGHAAATTTRNTHLSQRETLENSMCNLATALGVETIERFHGQGGKFYKVWSNGIQIPYQRASNVILELSCEIAARAGMKS